MPVGAGMAVADPLAQVAQVKDTLDNYRLTVSLSNITIQSVPNMAAAPLVREGYITATSTLGVQCTKGPCPEVLSSWLVLSAQVGCPTDLSEGIDLVPQSTLTAGLPPGLSLGQLLPNDPTGITNIAIAPTAASSLGALKVQLGPGSITDVAVGTMAFPAGPQELGPLKEAASLAKEVRKNLTVFNDDPIRQEKVANGIKDVGKRITEVLDRKAEDGLAVNVQNRHIVVQRTGDLGEPTTAACGGPVAIRLYANAVVTTRTSSDKVSVYSDILNL